MIENRCFPFLLNYVKNISLMIKEEDSSWLWHKRFGHLNFESIKLPGDKSMVHRLPQIEEKQDVYEGCARGKHHRQPFSKGVAWRAQTKLEIGAYVCRTMRTLSHFQNKYFILFINDSARMVRVIYFVREKSEILSFSRSLKFLLRSKVVDS